MGICDWSSDVCSSDLGCPSLRPSVFAAEIDDGMETAIDHALAVKGRFHVRILFHELFHPRVLHHLLMRAVAGFARGPFDKGEDTGFRSEERRVGKECVSTV